MKPLTLKQTHWLFFIVLVAYLCLGWFAMGEAFVGHPAVRAAVSAMAEWIPMLDSIKIIPGVNEWVRTFYAGVWLLCPFYIWLGWYHRYQECRELKEKTKPIPWWVLLGAMFLCYGVGVWILLFWPIPDINGWRDRSVASGMVGMAYTMFIMVGGYFFWGRLGRILYGLFRWKHINEYIGQSQHGLIESNERRA